MLDRISGREKLLISELERALKMQRGSRAQVEAIQKLLSESRRFEQPDVDRLQAARQTQNDVEQLLTSRGEGVPMHILAILADLENNRIEDADTRRRMDALLQELERLEREHSAADRPRADLRRQVGAGRS